MVHRATGVESLHTLNAPYGFIGRAQVVGVRLDDPSISQYHAYIQVVEGTLYCIDLGSRTGVFWDDRRQAQGWVHPEHTLRIGTFDVRLEGTPSAGASLREHDAENIVAPTLSPAALEFTTGNNPGSLFPLDRPITLIGRHPSCDLRLFDTSVGYFQCALVNTADGVWFVDLMTQTGGLLNGRATRLAQVRDKDLLEIGRVSLLIRSGIYHRNVTATPAESIAPVRIDSVAAISATVAESVAGAFHPIGEMVKQFQECFVSMAQMFSSMQQEHAALVQEQMRQIQDLAADVRELRAESRRDAARLPAAPPLTTTPAPASPPPTAYPTPPPRSPGTTPATNGDQTLPDAHAWFMERLANKAQTHPPGT